MASPTSPRPTLYGSKSQPRTSPDWRQKMLDAKKKNEEKKDILSPRSEEELKTLPEWQKRLLERKGTIRAGNQATAEVTNLTLSPPWPQNAAERPAEHPSPNNESNGNNEKPIESSNQASSIDMSPRAPHSLSRQAEEDEVQNELAMLNAEIAGPPRQHSWSVAPRPTSPRQFVLGKPSKPSEDDSDPVKPVEADLKPTAASSPPKQPDINDLLRDIMQTLDSPSPSNPESPVRRESQGALAEVSESISESSPRAESSERSPRWNNSEGSVTVSTPEPEAKRKTSMKKGTEESRKERRSTTIKDSKDKEKSRDKEKEKDKEREKDKSGFAQRIVKVKNRVRESVSSISIRSDKRQPLGDVPEGAGGAPVPSLMVKSQSAVDVRSESSQSESGDMKKLFEVSSPRYKPDPNKLLVSIRNWFRTPEAKEVVMVDYSKLAEGDSNHPKVILSPRTDRTAHRLTDFVTSIRKDPTKEYTVAQVAPATSVLKKILYHNRWRQLLEFYKNAPESKPERTRLNILQEIVASEESYNHYLDLAIMHWYLPLRERYNAQKDSVPNESQLGVLFSCIQAIQDISSRLGKALRERISDRFPIVDSIGEVFLEFLPLLKVYVSYINNFERADEVYMTLRQNEGFARFDDEARLISDNHNLRTILITPVQRVPRYVLLLQELIKVTPINHRDYTTLKQAIEKLVETTEYINTKKAEQAQLMEIQNEISSASPLWTIVAPDRRLIREGPVQYYSEKNKAIAAYLYLMNDLLLITAKEVGSISDNLFGKNKKAPKSLIASTSIRFMSVDATSADIGEVRVEVESEGRSKSWRFVCASPDEAKSWLDTLRETIGKFLKGREEPTVNSTSQNSSAQEDVNVLKEENSHLKQEAKRLLQLHAQEVARRKELEEKIAVLERQVLSMSEMVAMSEERANEAEDRFKELKFALIERGLDKDDILKPKKK